MIYIFDIFIDILYIQIASLWISILCMKFSTIMVDRTFPCHKADCSFQSISFLPFRVVISAGYGA